MRVYIDLDIYIYISSLTIFPILPLLPSTYIFITRYFPINRNQLNGIFTTLRIQHPRTSSLHALLENSKKKRRGYFETRFFVFES